jgi:beta-ureidopropionase / N-carbamoyl-L-amino-acid hydrolase
MPLRPSRTVDELRELHALTADEHGAQRVCWTPTWRAAREWFGEKLAALPVEVEQDEAGNLWATLRGEAERAVVIGGHLDSVENGGWLDGCLNVLAGLEVLRRVAEEGSPPVTLRLVDWADEEGFRFGRSLFGSSAAAGSLDADAFRDLRDRDGTTLPDALADFGVDLDRAAGARRQLESAGAYLELHVEQGPVLEHLGLPLGVVVGTYGVERHIVSFTGQRAHVGAAPMHLRRDAVAGAARLVTEGRQIAVAAGGVTTVGTIEAPEGIVTAVAPLCRMSFDQRHLDPAVLVGMLSDAKEQAQRIAEEEKLDVEWVPQWRIPPRPFDRELIELADEAVRETVGTAHRMPSGALHDAAEVAGAGVPTVMLFAQSLRGLSHNKDEDTLPEHLEASVEALDRLTAKAMRRLASRR